MRKMHALLAASVLSLGLTHNASAVPVDIAFIVDQSGSMGTEFGWLPTVMGDINTAIAGEPLVTSVRYGLAGYMAGAGDEWTSSPPAPNVPEYVGLAFVDMTSNIATVSSAATAAAGDLRAYIERGYHAANWARTGFSWDTAADAVKVMILLTDESADQGSTIPDAGQGSDEANLGYLLDQDGFLLNVVVGTNLYSQWDQAVFDQNSAYQGLFDINYLRTDPAGFTADFVAAKIGEIAGIPEPGTMLLMGAGLLGLAGMRRSKKT